MMTYGGIVANSSSNPSKFSHSSPFFASRLGYGLGLPSPPVYGAPGADSDALSVDTGVFDNGSFCFEDDDEDGLVGGDIELRSPVEERAPPSIFKSVRGSSPILVSSSFISARGGPAHLRTSGASSENSRASQRLECAHGTPSSRLHKPDSGSRPVDIVSPCTSTSKGSKDSKRSQKKLMSARESLLTEAWERKKDHMLHDEPSTGKEETKPEHLARSAPDCDNSPFSPTEATKTRLPTRSLTDDDFDELRGFIDLGFRFSEDCIPELCDTLPALEVYCAITQTRQDSPGDSSQVSSLHGVSGMQSPGSSPTSSWKVASPGDQPQAVKARLRHWAQAVACNLRQSY